MTRSATVAVGALSITLCLLTLAMIPLAAEAASPGPGWSISSRAEPTNFNAADTQDQEEQVAIVAEGGTYELKPEGHGAEPTRELAWNATASEVQQALEGIHQVGPGSYVVTGPPGGPYRVTLQGRFSGSEGPGFLSVQNNQLKDGAGEGQATVTQVQRAKARDQYAIEAVNVGDSVANGEVTITDDLPAQVVPVEAEVSGGTCTLGARVVCTVTGPVASEETLFVTIRAAVISQAQETIINGASVSGAGHAASTTQSTDINYGAAGFGIAAFNFEANGLDGSPDLQAGDHPFAATTTLDFNTTLNSHVGGEASYPYQPAQDPREVSVTLPPGFYGDPLAAAECPEVDLTDSEGAVGSGHYHALCPVASQVGTLSLVRNGGKHSEPFPLYNLVPEPGYPAELGVNALLAQPVLLYASVIPTANGYRLRVSTPGALRGAYVEGIRVTIFGSPGEHNGSGSAAAFVTSPTACSTTPLTANLETTSWEGGAATAQATAYPAITGCDLLQGVAQFAPSIAVEPETTQADTPSGYQIDLKVPQAPNSFSALATPELKDASVTLPAGVSVSPGSATGLGACTPAQIDLLGTKVGEGHPGGNGSPYDDGLTHASPGSCPEDSRLATVKIKTPLLESALEGHLFLAQPQCGGAGQPECTEATAEEGRVFGLYLEATGAGVIVKLAGTIEAGGYGPHSAATGLAPGQLRARFEENPQLPFEDLKLTFPGGQRAALANPQSCGTAATSSVLEPWSAPESGPNATPSSAFAVTGCANPQGFSPAFQGGTVTPLAGAYSPFTLTFSRHDGEQDLSGITVQTPSGLLGRIAGVPQCGEAQANAGSCGPESQIGTTTVTSGAGSAPLYLTGRVYLTGPYAGQPFGLSIVVPAVAGPFNLGNVVVRASIAIDPQTAALTTTSTPLPQIIDGVPTRIKTINVILDRPGFMFNPTNCSQQQLTAIITSAQGATARLSSPFAVAGCANLPFKPSFTASTAARASKAGGASLDVRVASKGGPQPGGGEANIRSVKVNLPKQLPSRLTTLQKACLAATFEANPAGCPKESNVGMATAATPVLAHPLVGPAYLVSHGGEAFPDLVIVLQGEGIRLDLVGNTKIKKGITSSTFRTVPDAPISSFELRLPTGKFSALSANLPQRASYSFCGQNLAMPTAITGQNGAVVKQSTKIAVSGCHRKLQRRHKRHSKSHRR